MKNNRDIIFLYNPEFHYIFPILLIARLKKIIIITEQTELQSALYLQPGNDKSLFYFLKKWSEKWIPYFSDGSTVISSGLYSVYASRYKNKPLIIIPPVFDEDVFKPVKIYRTYKIGYIGSFGVKDGIPGFINAFEKNAARFSTLSLYLIGDHSENPNIDKWVNNSPNKSRIHLTGKLSRDEALYILKGCDLLICNRINSSYAHFGFPTKVIEYAALGIPIIISNTGDISGKLGMHSHINYITPDNLDELTEAIYTTYINSPVLPDEGFYEFVKSKFGAIPNGNKLLGLIETIMVKK